MQDAVVCETDKQNDVMLSSKSFMKKASEYDQVAQDSVHKQTESTGFHKTAGHVDKRQ